jgi:integrase/recombinase XerD
MKIQDALDLFLLDCQSRRLTKSTVAFYDDKASRFVRWLADINVAELELVTATHIKRYMVSLQDRGLTDHSQHDYARVIRTFFAYCVRDELLRESPFARVKMPKVAEDLPVVLTDDEIKQALQRVKLRRNRLIIRFVLDSGVRAGELLRLNVGDVDMTTGVVTVRLGKGQRSRYTTIGVTTRKELKRYLLTRKSVDSNDPLLVGEQSNNKRLAYHGLMSAFRQMQEQSGVERLTAHTLRRTMATKSLESGLDAYIVARLLGHADLQMLRRYVQLRKEPFIKIGETCSVVDSLEQPN